MPVFALLLQRIYVALARMTWGTLLTLWLGHMGVSWLLYALAGETGLTGPFEFLYYYATTATTVGYGDLSPVTPEGRVAAFLFVLPGSIAVFTAVLGRGIADLGSYWRRGMNGLGDYAAREGHTLVLGWQGARTRRLVELLLADHPNDERMVLVAKSVDQNPMADDLDFVRTDALSRRSALVQAGAEGAQVIVVRGEDDDETLAATLAAATVAPETHIVAHFEDERAARLIHTQCPHVEAIGSLSAELLVRSARDPGASEMADRLFAADSSDTAFSMRVAAGAPEMDYASLLAGLHRRHQATLLGLAKADGLDLNCPHDERVRPGDTIFYVADERLDPQSVSWAEMRS